MCQTELLGQESLTWIYALTPTEKYLAKVVNIIPILEIFISQMVKERIWQGSNILQLFAYEYYSLDLLYCF